MAAGAMATAAGAAVVLYIISRRLVAAGEEEGDPADRGVLKSRSGLRRRISRRPAQAPATWLETLTTLTETLRFTYSETLGKWPIADLAFGINYLIRRQILKPAFTIIRDEGTKHFLLLIRGTHSIKDTLTAATGAVVPFHHSVLDDGGISHLVLGYAHCGMVAAARWIAKLSSPFLRKALDEYPEYKIKVVGHSLGGGTAALLTYILREQKSFSSSTCVTFAPAACMTWDLAESGKSFITTVINGSDLVPTFSTASIDHLRSEVTASSWLSDLRDQVEHTRVLNVVYRSASALGSHLPSIASAKARVAGAGALLRPVSSSTQVVMRRAQNVAQAVVRTRTSLSSWSCIGPRRRSVGPSLAPKEDDLHETSVICEKSETIVTEIHTKDLSQRKLDDHRSGSDSSSEEDEPLISREKVLNSSAMEEESTEGELWHKLAKELERHENEVDIHVQAEEAAAAKEIQEEERILVEATDTANPVSSEDVLESHIFYPPGKIMHIVWIPSSSEGGETTTTATPDVEETAEDHVGIYETPRELYSKIRLSKTMINDHYMPMYKKMMELLIRKLEEDGEDCSRCTILEEQAL
ncbi:Diacylglycerol lipase-alpha [Linum perenne]